MLESVAIDQSVISIAMVSGTETNVIYNIIEVREPVLNHNEKDTHMDGAILEGLYYFKKVMGEFLSLLTANGLCCILCEQAQ